MHTPFSDHFSSAIPTEENGTNHTPAFARSARTEEAHAATLALAKGIACVGWRVLTDTKYLEKVSSFQFPVVLPMKMLTWHNQQVKDAFKNGDVVR